MTNKKNKNPPIVLVSAIILTIITLLAGTLTYIVTERQAETLLGKSLNLSLASHVRLSMDEIESAYDTTVLISLRPSLSDKLGLTATTDSEIQAQNQLNKQFLPFAQERVKAIVYYDKNGQELISSGIISRQPELVIPLSGFRGNVNLIWDEGLILQSTVAIKKQGRIIGKVMTESLLPGTMSALRGATSLGETGELLLCSSPDTPTQIHCFPTALNPKIFTTACKTPSGVKLPIYNAIQAQTGFINTKDYRDQLVTAAHAPVGNYGLGMVLKMDIAEFNTPVLSQLQQLTPLILALAALALVLLRWLLRPLVLKLVQAESLLLTQNHQISETNKELEFQKKTMDEHSIVSITDARGLVTYTNDKFCEISGYSCAELLGQNHPIIKSDQHSKAFFINLWKTIANGKTWHGEVKTHTKDGSHYWIQSTIVPFLNDQGQPIKYVSIGTDITARKDVERANRTFEETLELSTDAIRMFWSDTLEYFYANQSSLNLTGHTKEQFIGSSAINSNFNLSDKKLRRMRELLISGEKKSISYELNYVNWDDKLIHYQVSLQYITPEGEKPRFVSISHNIAERKRAEELTLANEKAEASKLAQSQFLSHMSHELRTPLHAVIGLSKVLVSDTKGLRREKQNEYLNAIHNSGQHLLQLIGNILDLSKLNSDARDLELRPFTLTELVDECRNTFDLSCEEKGISLTIDNQLAGAPTLLGDITALKQIVFNLLGNAVKFTESGTITLTIAPQLSNSFDNSHTIAFTVTDTGKGIASEAIGMLFNRFTQEDNSITRSFGGSGLGLSISQGLANLMGGNITCTSSLGKGSKFAFMVNLEPQYEVIVKNTSDDLAAYKLPPLKILLVDDIPLNLAVAEALLEPKGHMVATASSGEEAIVMASNHPYDVILMDIHMPGMNGMEATQAIRSIADEQRAGVPIIALSADVNVIHQASFIASGMNASWSKSVLASGFDTELQHILKLK